MDSVSTAIAVISMLAAIGAVIISAIAYKGSERLAASSRDVTLSALVNETYSSFESSAKDLMLDVAETLTIMLPYWRDEAPEDGGVSLHRPIEQARVHWHLMRGNVRRMLATVNSSAVSQRGGALASLDDLSLLVELTYPSLRILYEALHPDSWPDDYRYRGKLAGYYSFLRIQQFQQIATSASTVASVYARTSAVDGLDDLSDPRVTGALPKELGVLNSMEERSVRLWLRMIALTDPEADYRQATSQLVEHLRDDLFAAISDCLPTVGEALKRDLT